MISPFDLWQKLIGTVNTHQGGHIRPHRNFIEWVNDISLAIFEDEYAEWEKTQIVSDRLMPFLESINIVITPVANQMWDIVNLPTGYEHFSSLRYITKEGKPCGCKGLKTIDGATGEETECPIYLDADEQKQIQRDSASKICELPIKKVRNNQWGSLCEHKALRPTIKKPACTQYAGGLKIAPKNLGVVVFDFLRIPAKAVFNYTIINPGTETEYIQYTPTGSVSLEWSETLINEFILRLQKKYGIFTREQLLWETGEQDRKNNV